MWNYEKKLQYPIKISKPNPKYAKIIITQYGGPDGELGASMRYLSQRYTMPYREVVGILNDIGTEELAHLEMVSSIVYQLLRNATTKEIEEGGFSDYFVDHTTGIWPQSAGGVPFNALTFQSKGDVITDLTEDMAAEGTITKEQPVFSVPEKALFNAVFWTFRVLAQNRRLRPHKNNKSQKYDRTSCFQMENQQNSITGTGVKLSCLFA